MATLTLAQSRVAVLAEQVEAALDTGRAVVEVPTIDLARLLMIHDEWHEWNRLRIAAARYTLERLVGSPS